MRIWLAILIVFCTFFGAMAQETPEVHKINGKRYYLHEVEKGNTLYGISKQYLVSIEDIQSENVDALKEGLKIGQTLLIPVNSDNKKELAPITQEDSYISHAVQPGETLYSISKKYEVALDKLLESNPEIKNDGLKANSLIKVPLGILKVSPAILQPAKTEQFKTHTVAQGETVYSISKLYQLKADELTAINDGFPNGLKIGMTIRIPSNAAVLPSKTTVTNLPLPVVEPVPTIAQPQVLRVILLLPFNPLFPDSANASNFKISEQSRVALNYFRGFKYAADSISKREQIKIELHAMNTERDSVSLEMIFRNEEFNRADLVVGPFFTDQFERAATYCAAKGIPIICPIEKPSKILFKHANAIKTVPSESMQLSSLAEFAAKELKDSTLVLINGNKYQNQENIEFFKSRYAKAAGVPDTFNDDAIREVKLWDVNRETLKLRFPEPGSYVCIVPTSNPVFMTKLLGGMFEFAARSGGTYRFRVIGMEEWQKREIDLDIHHLHALHVTLPMTTQIDFNDEHIQSFYKSYQQAHGFDPDIYAIQAFDLVDYLVLQSKKNGVKSLLKAEKTEHRGLVESYSFTRVLENSGVENKAIKLYEYNNYRLKYFGSWPQIKKQ